MRAVYLTFIGCLLSGCNVIPETNSSLPLNTGSKNHQPSIEDSTLVHPVAAVTDSLEQLSLSDVATVTEVTLERDLWRYLANNMETLDVDPERVQYYIDWYKRHPNYMQRITNRAKFFLYYIATELEAQDMPLELALLPIVESSFDPFAYSHGSASGLWQFIPKTGERFGMEQNWWYDGRRDLVASTQGAIAYLQYLHRFFDGNWEHALAAYNSGEGRVRRAIRKNTKKGLPTDFWSLSLPKETRSYVPKLMALVHLLKHAQEHDFAWPVIPNQSVIDVVAIDGQIDLAIAAELAGLTVTELHALNPGFNRWATAPDGPHRLVLPIDRVAPFNLALSELDAQERVMWVRHRVERGESLGVIARHYNTSVKLIKDINALSDNVIVAGKHLLVPQATESLDTYRLSQKQRTLRLQQRKKADVRIKHTVAAGDTLWDIAKAYKTSSRKIASWNGLSPKDYLRPGQELVIWYQADKPVGVTRTVTYTVRRGDSLARIGQKFNVRINQIKQWNDLAGQKYLQPGQQLKLVVDVTKTSNI